ncbi:hypothetical protein IEQ34_000195 [Dendrobium chrysotoxum]|uniref:Uncharacterized protein n=1 Tax=Dendrobium chrysotoxum TaxID=161865 RepID=A0AAV7HNX9_DENCH|nr:hypothetical protein IEQ34_000195 [Dendrobium chrysotoxum]
MSANQLNNPGFLNGEKNSHSILDSLSGVSSSDGFLALKTTTHRGLPSLWISDEEVLALAAPFKFVLVGKFFGWRPILDSIHKFLFNLKLIGALGFLWPCSDAKKLDIANKLSITTTVTHFLEKQKLMTVVNVENACLSHNDNVCLISLPVITSAIISPVIKNFFDINNAKSYTIFMVHDTNVIDNFYDLAPITEYVNHVGISTITLNELTAIKVSEPVVHSIPMIMIESLNITKVLILNILISPISDEALLHLGLGKSTLALFNLVDQSD